MKKQNSNKREQAKFTTNKIPPEEYEQIQRWADPSGEERQQLAEATILWNMMDRNNKKSKDYNADLAWGKVKDSIQHYEWRRARKAKRIKIYASMAAVLVIGIFLLYQFTTNAFHDVRVAETGQVKSITLGDGSTVTLNTGSSMTCPKYFFGRDTREVQLTGEAYFEVRNNLSKPFVVVTEETSIQVLGTSFNVNAHDEGLTEVTVTNGKVTVSHKSHEKMVILPNERAVITKKDVHKTPNRDVNYLAWKTKKFTFNNAELKDVVEQIEPVYHCQIQFADPELKKCRLTAVFDNEELEDIIRTIRLAFDIQAEYEQDQYILSGTGCP